MISNDLGAIVDILERKIDATCETQLLLSSELSKYKKENFQLKNEIGKKNKLVEELEKKLLMKSWSSNLSDKQKESIRLEIDGYISDIESSIACISKQL